MVCKNMTDYWKNLTMLEKWDKKERFNYILNYLHSNVDSEVEKEPEVVVDKVGSVAVHIVDSEDEPITGAVVVFSKDGKEYTCTTGRAGGCSMSNVVIGEYDTSVTADDYIQDIDSFTVVEGENTFELALESDIPTGSGAGAQGE